jgi:seryl-tRNA synthetase
MLDIKFIREHPDLIREAARKKRVDFKVEDLLAADEKRRALLKEVEEKRALLNARSKEVSTAADPAQKEMLIGENRGLKEELGAQEEELKTIEAQFDALMLGVPNMPDPSVPEGESDADNQEIRTWGKPRSGGVEPKDHITLMRELDLVDFERGSSVSGFRGYFLKNDAVLLSFALWQFVFEHFRGRGYEPMMAPALVRERNLFGTGHFPQAREDVFKTQDDLYLSATAEIPLMGFHADEILEEHDLPKKYLAFSPCFRREAGAYGKDTKGIYRLHEFFKIEQLIISKRDHQDTVTLHEELTKNAEEIVQALQLPYQVVAVCGGDLGRAHVKSYDINVWIPSEQRYRESHTSSYYHDFQTRRLNIRYKDNQGEMRFCYSLNNTAIATPRILIALLENYQEADGSVRVPEVLQRYVGKAIIAKNMGGD